MYKKVVDRCRLDSKAQVTIFIILGLIILFAFLFLILLSGKLQRTQLQEAKEGVLSKAFQKEGLRIFVEDCLSDKLEEGLILIGRQGRLWTDNPGGRKFFEHKRTGVQISPNSDDRIFYGISNETYFQHDRSYYPCNERSDSPGVCTYRFANTSLGFGKLEWRASTLAGDLERYLINRTVVCIDEFVTNNISQAANFESTENIDLNLVLNDDSIGVQAEYPLRFTLGSEELFHISNFDFTYTTKFKQLLDSAVTFPLERDQRFVDFDYSENTLTADTFPYESEDGPQTQSTRSQTYRQLSVALNKFDFDGDDIFEFTLPEGIIVHRPGSYIFRVARQNRPPALDYISQCSDIENYDYLVVKDADSPLGELDFRLSANDADEDGFTFATVSSQLTDNNPADEHFSSDVSAENSGDYEVAAFAIDSHDLDDKQIVRVRIDDKIEPIPTFVNLLNPVHSVSLEDPVCVTLDETVPGLRSSLNGQALPLSSGENGLFDSTGAIITGCVGFTWDNPSTGHDINSIKNYLTPYFPSAGTSRFVAQAGRVQYTDEVECGYDIQVDLDVNTQECTNHVNQQGHPFPYVPGETVHNLKQESSGEFTDEEINPFFATNGCCVAGLVVTDGSECFNQLGCFTDPIYLQRMVATCDGLRGNICGGPKTVTFEQINNKNVCGGDQFLGSCNQNIPQKCQGKESNALLVNEGWCYGTFGCENLCTVQDGGIVYDVPSQDQLPLGVTPATNPAQFKCGCNEDRLGMLCDKNLDGTYNGNCVETGLFFKRYECAEQ